MTNDVELHQQRNSENDNVEKKEPVSKTFTELPLVHPETNNLMDRKYTV